MDREPMFCFETSIKLYYFSHIIYFYDKARGGFLFFMSMILIKSMPTDGRSRHTTAAGGAALGTPGRAR